MRYDDHEFYGKIIDKIKKEKKNFLSGTLNLIGGTNFKAPTSIRQYLCRTKSNFSRGFF